MGVVLSTDPVESSIAMRARLSWRARKRQQNLQEVVEEALAAEAMTWAGEMLILISQMRTSWRLKGGGAVWWTALQMSQRPWASAELKGVMHKLGLLTVYDLDFEAMAHTTMDVLKDARWFSSQLDQFVGRAFSWRRHWLATRRCRMVQCPLVIAFQEGERRELGKSPGPLAPSLHHGRNTNTGEEYQLLRMSFVVQHQRGFFLRIPCLDVNLRKNEPTLHLAAAGACVARVAGVDCVSLPVLQDDLARMIFRDTNWKPWLHPRPEKTQRRVRRWMGVTFLMCHPLSAPWLELSEVLDFVRAREAQLLPWDAKSCLRCIRRISRQGPAPFQEMCTHIHIALEDSAAHCEKEDDDDDDDDEEFVDFLDFLLLLVEALATCSEKGASR